MKQLTVLIFFVLISITTFAQKEYISGWILTNSNDTIHGLIENKKDLYKGIGCNFKLETDSLAVQFLPNDIQAYYLSNNRYFISKKINLNGTISKVFLQVLVLGELDIYKYINLNRKVHYFVDNEGFGFSELYSPFEHETSVNGKKYIKTISPYKGILINYTLDKPKFKNRLYNLNILSSKELIDIGVDYHNAVCKDGNCKVYFYEY